MNAVTGIQALVDYSAIADNRAKIQALIDLIPDPDTTNTSGAQAGGGFLDEMSPSAAVGMRVELAALKVAIEEGEGEGYANGTHAVTGGEAAAHTLTIDTGLDTDDTFTTLIVDIVRAGASVKADAVVTDNGDGTFTVADGAATYDVTAADSIVWFAEV